jgi:5-methylcytosine-specific restriction endonuclease McrA
MKYSLGSKVFNTKKSVKAYFKNIIIFNAVGSRLEKESRRVLRDLITYHPEYDKWKPDGKLVFKVDVDNYKSKTFWYQEKYTTPWHVFSYSKCIRGLPTTPIIGACMLGTDERAIVYKRYRRRLVQDCARIAIQEQIYDFKSKRVKEGQYQCALCGYMFTRVDCDHTFDVITFQQLLDNWLNSSGRIYSTIKFDSTTYGRVFQADASADWQAYHREHAVLRLLCRACHTKRD